MALNLLQRHDLSDGSSNIFKRTKAAMIITAIAVQNEAVNTANHAQRSAFSQRVLHDPDYWVNRIAWGVISQATAAADSDDLILGYLGAIWNAYAVVYVAPAE